MDALISRLPQNQTGDEHSFCVIDNSENDEGNVRTVAQVAAAKVKGWRPCYWNGTEWTDYEGSDEPDWGPDDPTDISQYANIVYLEAVTTSTESTISVPVKMKNALANIMGFQFDLILPSGVTVAKDEDGFYLIELSADRTTARKHTVSAQQQSDGSIRVVCYSNNNSTSSGDEILTIDIHADDNAPLGSALVALKNITLSRPDVTGVTLRDFDNELFVMDDDGIDDIVSPDKDKATVFSLSGQRLTAPRKGVNIVGGRKVVVK